MSRLSKSEAMAMAWNINQAAENVMVCSREMRARHTGIALMEQQSVSMWGFALKMSEFALEIARKHGIEQSAMEADT